MLIDQSHLNEFAVKALMFNSMVVERPDLSLFYLGELKTVFAAYSTQLAWLPAVSLEAILTRVVHANFDLERLDAYVHVLAVWKTIA